jgi:hypothetical protein
MPTYQEGNIECPFYLGQENCSIKCEGHIKEMLNNKLIFKNAEQKKKYIDTYCVVDGGRRCVHYRLMSSLYDRGVLK